MILNLLNKKEQRVLDSWIRVLRARGHNIMSKRIKKKIQNRGLNLKGRKMSHSAENLKDLEEKNSLS